MRIAIIESVNGGWGYCPEGTPLVRVLQYDDEASFQTQEEAIADANANASIPNGTQFVIVPNLRKVQS